MSLMDVYDEMVVVNDAIREYSELITDRKSLGRCDGTVLVVLESALRQTLEKFERTMESVEQNIV